MMVVVGWVIFTFLFVVGLTETLVGYGAGFARSSPQNRRAAESGAVMLLSSLVLGMALLLFS